MNEKNLERKISIWTYSGRITKYNNKTPRNAYKQGKNVLKRIRRKWLFHFILFFNEHDISFESINM